jgi:accessory colonization factor AcfC
VYEIQYRAKAIIDLRAIEQIKPYKYKGQGTLQLTGAQGPHPGFVAAAKSWNNNTALGYQAGLFNVGTGISTAKIVPNNNITFNTPLNPVLTITGDGDVIWSGKPSEAADILVQSFQFAVEDKKGITKAARRRYYYRACKNLLAKAEKMEHPEFVDFLRKHVYNKERRVIMSALKGEDDVS